MTGGAVDSPVEPANDGGVRAANDGGARAANDVVVIGLDSPVTTFVIRGLDPRIHACDHHGFAGQAGG
jgi:hypothetical protein